MKKALAIILLIPLMAAAGYLGFQSQAGPSSLSLDSLLARVGLGGHESAGADAVQAPNTVEVSIGDVDQTVEAPGQLVGTQEELLSFDVGGKVAAIMVRPGDRVTAGQELARLDSGPLEEALALAELKLAQAEAENERQVADAELELEIAQAAVTQTRAGYPGLTAAQIQLEQATANEAYALQEYNEALDRPWEPAEVVEGYRRQYEAAVDAREIAQADLDAVNNQRWAVSQEVLSAETRVTQAQAKLEQLQEGVDPLLRWDVDQARADLEAATLRAPFDGVVLEVTAKAGEAAAAGAGLMTLADPQAAEVRATVVEEDLPLVEVSQPAELFFDAAPDEPVAGRVERIVPQRLSSDRALYEVYLSVERLPAQVVPGMTADATIIIDRTADVVRLPRSLVQAGASDTAVVRVWRNNASEERTVTVGLRGDVYVEILSGLQPGEQVIVQ
jgi:HlyD family secretion protein